MNIKFDKKPMKISDLIEELDYIKKTTIQQMYLNDLEELKKKFEKEFK